jgi:hypothetical protein
MMRGPTKSNVAYGPLLRLQKVATRCVVSLRTVEGWVASGRIEVLRLSPREVRATEEALARFLDRATRRGNGDALAPSPPSSPQRGSHRREPRPRPVPARVPRGAETCMSRSRDSLARGQNWPSGGQEQPLLCPQQRALMRPSGGDRAARHGDER